MRDRLVISRFGYLFIGALLMNGSFSFSEEIRYDSGSRRDPFVPVKEQKAVAKPRGVTDILVEGIVYDQKGKSIVIIHGEAYSVGQMIGPQKLVEVHPRKIITEMDGKRLEYWMAGDEHELSKTKKAGI